MTHRPLTLALCLFATGCTHMGTHISADFACRAPKGACAPSSAVDAEAVKALVHEAGGEASRPRISVAAEDTDRTGERKLRIVFPAYVDGRGTLHEEAVAWAIVEPARWAGELRAPETPHKNAFARHLQRALKTQSSATPARDPRTSEPLFPEDGALFAPVPSIPAAPLFLPSPGDAAASGAGAATTAPGAEGSDMPSPPDVRTPRPLSDAAPAKEPR